MTFKHVPGSPEPGSSDGGAVGLQLPPLSLYIHIPWCVRKCPYCDFNSHQSKGELPEAEYIAALLEDLAQDLPYVQGRELGSIFFGGGTPSLFSAQSYDRLLGEMQKMLSFAADIEITLEANPGTAERQKFRDFRRLGINRLSVGVQSFDDAQLHVLGRIHSSDEARKALDLAGTAGFDNFNIDIMYALPQQSQERAMADLREALSFAPAHLSWYQLTIEPNTEFFKRPPPLPAEAVVLDIQDAGLELLAEAGYARYEVSAFARPGRQSRHNLNYWLFGDYLGIGAGAHGKISLPDRQQILRSRKKRQPAHYLARPLSYSAGTDPVRPDELALEFMLNALRLNSGFPMELFEARTGLSFSAVEKQLQSLQDRGLLAQVAGRIQTTAKGMQFLNSILEEFV